MAAMESSASSPEDRAALDRVTTNGRCPFCAGTVWSDSGMAGRGYVAVSSGIVDVPARFDTFTLVCQGCGFVRQHALEVLGLKP
jgi:hypothetical protein